MNVDGAAESAEAEQSTTLDVESDVVWGEHKRWTFPTGVDRWLAWAGVVLTVAAAFALFSYLSYAVALAWNFPPSTSTQVPRVSAYPALVLIAGVLMLAALRSSREVGSPLTPSNSHRCWRSAPG